MKILIIQQKMIGDVLTSSILFEALKEEYPNSELHYIINSHTFPVVENNPFIDKFVFFTPEIENSKLKLFQFLKSIKQEKFDAVIDVYGKLSSNLISLFSKSKLKIGYHKKQSSFIYTNAVKRKKKPEYNSSLAIENRILLLEPLNVPFKNYQPKIYLKKIELDNAKKYLQSQQIDLNKPLYMISVLGSNAQKTYPFDYMAKLLDEIVISKPKAQILFNYIPKQEKDAKSIFDLCTKKTQEHVFFNVYGKNLREFLAITYHCNALIGNEGGANNMAKALNIPTFTIFSPYLNKHNWFGETETKKHIAIHLSDYINYNEGDMENAKKKPEAYYRKLKPEYFKSQLKSFLTNLD